MMYQYGRHMEDTENKQMKRGYCKAFYNQRNKDETIISVIKRLFGEHITSRLVRTQNRKLSFRCIGYNMQRLTNLIILLMVSTKPIYAEKRFYTFINKLSNKPAIVNFL